jgi:hypothetical protein
MIPVRDSLIASLSRASAQLAVLEILATFGKATTRQVARFRFGEHTVTQEERTSRILSNLRADGLVRTLPAKDDIAKNPRLLFFVPVHGLTELGCEVAMHYGYGDPKPFEPEHSLLTLEHETKLADTHFRLEQFCESEGWAFSARQTDLAHSVKPDRLFAIDKGHGFLPLFYEEENKKKDFQNLYEKAVRYFDYWDTYSCEREWGWFRKFHVLWQFPNEERMINFVRFLAGECQCTKFRGTVKHTCLPHGLRKKILKADTLWFTHDELTKDIGGKIWLTPQVRQYSLSDL